MHIVQRVENWCAENLNHLKSQWRTISIRSYESSYAVRGKVTIEAGSDRIAAYVTFWNKGDVDAGRMDLPEKRISIIDDRAVSKSARASVGWNAQGKLWGRWQANAAGSLPNRSGIVAGS